MHSGDITYPQIASTLSSHMAPGRAQCLQTTPWRDSLSSKPSTCHSPEQALYSFQAIEHRMELVGTWRGVRFVNDSKATNLDATTHALSAMPRGKTHLISGGTDKGNDYSQILDLVKEKCKTLLYLTTDSHRLHAISPHKHPMPRPPEYGCTSTTPLPTSARRRRHPPPLPRVPALDLFRNYEDRQDPVQHSFTTSPPLAPTSHQSRHLASISIIIDHS